MPEVVEKKDPDEPEDQALGRSRGGCSTKIPLICEADGCPIHFELSAGQAHENTTLVDLLNGIDDEMTTGKGTLVPWPATIAGDKGYRANWIDEMFLERGVTPVIPSKSNEDRDARSVPFDKARYRQRNIVERVIGWLKECRCVFARFEKTAANFAGMIKMAFIQRYLKILAPRVSGQSLVRPPDNILLQRNCGLCQQPTVDCCAGVHGDQRLGQNGPIEL